MGLSYLIRQIAVWTSCTSRQVGQAHSWAAIRVHLTLLFKWSLIFIYFFIENIQYLHFADILQPHSPGYTTKVQVWPLLIQLQHSYAEKVGAWQQQRMWLTHTPRKPNNRCLNSLCALCAHWKGKGSLGDTCTKTSVGGSPLPIFPISPSCVNANVYEWKNSHWCRFVALSAQCSMLNTRMPCCLWAEIMFAGKRWQTLADVTWLWAAKHFTSLCRLIWLCFIITSRVID